MRYLLAAICLLGLTSCAPLPDDVDPMPEPSQEHHEHDGHDHEILDPITNQTAPERATTTFAQDVDSQETGIRLQQQRAKSFSEDMRTAMGLTDSHVAVAEKNDRTWNVGEYIIAARHFAQR